MSSKSKSNERLAPDIVGGYKAFDGEIKFNVSKSSATREVKSQFCGEEFADPSEIELEGDSS